MDSTYRSLFADRQSRRLIGAVAVAWLSIGMVGLAIFLTAHRASNSYGLAGVVVAAFSVGSGAFAPLRGRLLDRRGTRPWLIVLASGYATALVALALFGQLHAPAWALAVCATTGGASAPPLVASLRSLWPSVVDEPLVRRAYALTSVVSDVGLVAAPALAAAIFVAVAWLPLVICAATGLAAAIVIVVNSPRARERAQASASGEQLLTRRFTVVLGVEVALGVALGLVEVAVPTAATKWGETAYSGALLAAFALGSVLGGVWFGRRHWRATADQRYLVASLVVGAALLPPIAASGAITLAPLLVIAGLSYGPATISLFEAIDDLTVSRATEAFTWITTSAAIGTAAGSAGAGWATTSLGIWAPFAIASSLLIAAAAAGLRMRVARSGNPRGGQVVRSR